MANNLEKDYNICEYFEDREGIGILEECKKYRCIPANYKDCPVYQLMQKTPAEQNKGYQNNQTH